MSRPDRSFPRPRLALALVAFGLMSASFVQAAPWQEAPGDRKERLTAKLEKAVAEIDRHCTLAPEQRKKLEITAKGALENYLSEADGGRAAAGLLAIQGLVRPVPQEEKRREIFRIHLSQGMQSDILENAVWVKGVRSILKEQQLGAYLEVLQERRDFELSGTAIRLVATLDEILVLTREQREQLLEIVLERLSKGENDRIEWISQWFMDQSSDLPPATTPASLIVPSALAKEVLDESQFEIWTKVQKSVLTRFGGFEDGGDVDFQTNGDGTLSVFVVPAAKAPPSGDAKGDR